MKLFLKVENNFRLIEKGKEKKKRKRREKEEKKKRKFKIKFKRKRKVSDENRTYNKIMNDN
jgi:hypothetical protein